MDTVQVAGAGAVPDNHWRLEGGIVFAVAGAEAQRVLRPDVIAEKP